MSSRKTRTRCRDGTCEECWRNFWHELVEQFFEDHNGQFSLCTLSFLYMCKVQLAP
jgi:hypothetical protein